MAAFDLWDVSTGNRIVETDDEDELRDILHNVIALGTLPDNLSLGLPDNVTILDGRKLVDWLGRV